MLVINANYCKVSLIWKLFMNNTNITAMRFPVILVVYTLAFLLENLESCCSRCCSDSCNNCRNTISRSTGKLPCCRSICDFDEESPFLRTTPRKLCQQCPVPDGYCDPPSNNLVPLALFPTAHEEPPMFLSALTDRNDNPICGASIISTHFVISSCKRCLSVNKRPVPTSGIKVVIGGFVEDGVTGMALHYIRAKRISLHHACFIMGRYSPAHDLGIVQTETPLNITNHYKPAIIPGHYGWRPHPNKSWTLANFRMKHVLALSVREASWYIKVKQVPSALCRIALDLDRESSSKLNPVQHYCTQYDHPSRSDGCKEDYGAALSYDGILFGLLIFKYSCGKARSVAGHISIAANSEWIANEVSSMSRGSESVTNI